jgi:hypothetical protein
MRQAGCAHTGGIREAKPSFGRRPKRTSGAADCSRSASESGRVVAKAFFFDTGWFVQNGQPAWFHQRLATRARHLSDVHGASPPRESMRFARRHDRG